MRKCRLHWSFRGMLRQNSLLGTLDNACRCNVAACMQLGMRAKRRGGA